MNATFFLPMVISLGVVFVLPLTNKRVRARLARDPAEAIMFGVAGMLALSLLVSAAMVVRTHNVEIIKIPILAAGVFAVVGIAFGLFRSLRKPRGSRI